MYTRQEQQQADKQAKQRLLTVFLPAAVVFAVAVTIFVIGRLGRNEDAWKLPAALTLLAGVYAVFFYGVYAKPMLSYRKHLNYMLDGRHREATGYLTQFSENLSERNGVECHAIMINVGEKDDREDDRLYYYDVKKLPVAFELGEKITVVSNDMMVAELKKA